MENTFLNEIKGTMVSAYLSNGVELKGVLHSFSEHAIFMESFGKPMMVYKANIASIAPHKKVKSFEVNGNR